jgi:multidrug efflux pump subunit AcrA (membrane-fusion protein)
VSRRFAVAPFDGLVVSGFVEPGDFVRRDQVLAEIDGRSIRWELSGVVAERHQSLRQREIELAEGNIPETFLAELENERLTSQERILKFKRDHLEIRSPTDGVVLSGSLERSVAASVTTGETLFEIAPLHPMKVEVAIPDDEIAQVKLGSPVSIWIEGQEESPIKGKITRIHPRSETRDADNVFIAEVEHGNEEENLRPGMKGSVRIDCDKQPLAWCVFHKPVNYLRSRLTWW